MFIELLKYASPKSIWVVNYENKLMELECPFNVKCINDIGFLKTGEIYQVSYIKLSTDFKIVYLIEGKLYFYYHFTILIK